MSTQGTTHGGGAVQRATPSRQGVRGLTSGGDQVAGDSTPLAGKCAVVTGGGAGIGRASAHALAARGAAVAVVDIDEAAAETVTREIMAQGGRATPVAADVATAEGAARVAQAALEELGGLDILHNNAGIQRYGTVIGTEEAGWDDVLRVNAKSVYLV